MDLLLSDGEAEMTALDQQRGHLSAERGSMRGAGRMSDLFTDLFWSVVVLAAASWPVVFVLLAIKLFE